MSRLLVHLMSWFITICRTSAVGTCCFSIGIAASLIGCTSGATYPFDDTTTGVTISIHDGATDVSVNTPIFVNFGRSMLDSTITAASFFVARANFTSPSIAHKSTFDPQQCDPAQIVPSELIHLSDAQYLLLFSEALEEGITYTLCLTNAIQFADGTSFEGSITSFTTAGSAISPSATLIVESGFTSVPLDAPITVSFSRTVNPATINANTFFIVSLADNAMPSNDEHFDPLICDQAQAIPGSVTMESLKRYSLHLTNRLESDKRYALCLTTDIHYGRNAFEGTTIFIKTVDLTPARVLITSPIDGSVHVAVNTAIEATLTKPVDPLTINSETVFVSTPSGFVDGTVELDPNGVVIRFTPTNNLDSFTVHTVTISHVIKDETGDPLEADEVWTFTTADIIAPTMVSSDPAANAQGIPVNSAISAVFSEPMDPATFIAGVMTVTSPEFGDVAGNISYDEATRTAVFTPSTPLISGTTYNATLANTVKDIHGNVIASSSTWSFRTVIGNIVQVALGPTAYHTVVITEDSRVWAWGRNNYGQLGDGTTIDRVTPVRVAGFKDVIAVCAGNGHTAAVKSDGTVWTWGDNSYGQLGDGTTTQRTTPTQVAIANARSVACGSQHTMVLKNDNTVWSFGNNTFGQLGDNTLTQRKTPIQVLNVGAGADFLTNVRDIGCGQYHSVALKNDGSVVSWGYNVYGQLGDGSTVTKRRPVQTLVVNEASAIAAGATHSLALKSDGNTIWAWGYNGYGQIGNDSVVQVPTPVTVMQKGGGGTLSGIKAIAAGTSSSMALSSDGNITWGWGANSNGQLGDNTALSRTTPIEMHGIEDAEPVLTGISAIASGAYHTIALRNSGTVVITGFNYHGEAGSAATFVGYTPHTIDSLSNIIDIATGSSSSYAVKSDGSVWAWGRNNAGQLGDNTQSPRNTPVQVHGLNDVGFLSNMSKVSAGASHTVTLKDDGTVWAWGNNNAGQLGDNSTFTTWTPVQVVGSGGIGFLTDIIAVAAGMNSTFTVALKSDHTVWTWGNNSNGQLGNNSTNPSSVPVQVLAPNAVDNLTNITAIAAGKLHTLALKDDGTVWAWGINTYGQLGNGNNTQSLIPVQVSGAINIVQIAAGLYTSSAVAADGSIWTWGLNTNGSLGINSQTNSNIPVQVHGVGDVGTLANIAAVGAGNYHMLARSNSGTTYAWGFNDSGQLGIGNSRTQLVPAIVPNLQNVQKITCGDSLTNVLTSGGTVLTFGWNSLQTLLDNTNAFTTTPLATSWQ